MATQNIPRHTVNRNQNNKANREDTLRIARERAAAIQAAIVNIIHATVYQTTDPGPDFTPRPWR